MAKGIGRIYKYDQQNWPYPSQNTAFVVTQISEASIQTQCTSASDANVGEHTLSSSGFDQRNKHHVNTDINNNDYSQSFETPRGDNCSSYSFGDTTNTTNTPYSSTLPLPVK